jgi:YfiH family protein
MTKTPPSFHQADALVPHTAIRHGFFGRRGGISSGLYTSLNCGPGSGDIRASVLENRRRATAALSLDAALVTLYQVHSSDVVIVNEPWEIADNPKADAMATNKSGLALGILTADCAPILLADADAHVIGAAHAGWGGALAGVAESVTAAMVRLGGKRERICAAIGPCISQSSYEVGPEFKPRFVTSDPANERFFVPSMRARYWQFDLPGYVAHRLRQSGIATVEVTPACTYAAEAEYFSYRRTTHFKEPDYGRQLSAIMLTD